MLKEFKEFISKGNVLAVAVALIMALYFQKIVEALLNGVILPIVSAIFGKPNFAEIGFSIGKAYISIGLVLDAIISFVIVAFVLFLIIKAYNRVAGSEEEAGPSEIDLLTDIRDSLRNR